MTDVTEEPMVFETVLDAPPETVWRALTIPEYLERWLLPLEGEAMTFSGKDEGLAERIDWTLVAEEPNRRLTYRWRESGKGATDGDSLVTFELDPLADEQTLFRLTHSVPVPAANDNGQVPMMMAA
jgi:uncharacterized protein YndB with AHSA1/START domain